VTGGRFLYDERPEFYDRIHAHHDYRGQAAALHALLAAEGVGAGARVIEAACGTGNYLVELAGVYEVSGFDRSEAMLAIARRKLSAAELFLGDLREFTLLQPADAVLCLCSAIAYLASATELRAALTAFARAVRPGGVIVLRPWLTPERAVDGMLWMDTYTEPGLKLCRQAVLRRAASTSVLDFHWLIATAERGVEHHVDRHELALFSDREIAEGLAAAGLSAIRTAAPAFASDLWIARRGPRP